MVTMLQKEHYDHTIQFLEMDYNHFIYYFFSVSVFPDFAASAAKIDKKIRSVEFLSTPICTSRLL